MRGITAVGAVGGATFGLFISLYLAEVMPGNPTYPAPLHAVWAAVLGMFGYAYARQLGGTRRVR